MNKFLHLVLQLQIILILWSTKSILAQTPASTNCTPICGNVTIPFPFGIERGCSVDGGFFNIECNSSKPFLKTINMEVLDISLDGTIVVNHPVLFNSCDSLTTSGATLTSMEDGPFPFIFSQTNTFIGIGCGKFSFLATDNSVIGECSLTCSDGNTNNSCQSEALSSIKEFIPSVQGIKMGKRFCNYAFLADKQWVESTNLKNNPQDFAVTHVPLVLEWSIFFSYFRSFAWNKLTSTCEVSACSCYSSRFPTVRCNCLKGYQGNPYLLQGCQDIDECAANTTICGQRMLCENFEGGYNCSSLTELEKSKTNMVVICMGSSFGGFFLLLGVWWLWIMMKKRKDTKLKEKFFKRNGGLLLQQQLTSFDGSVDQGKLFSSKELDKATDHFNVNRILGKGGQGTVYKGMLADGRIVAVKRSTVVDQGKLEEFINEVAILSQLYHRNVVKLLGCCLETDVPLLVYEFIPNGTLSHYLHVKDEELPITWDMRLRIAVEAAGAISYLHSSASIPIYHRDIKSANILLDDKYRAKVADFGTSKTIDIDQTHVTTKVMGTFGYLDPEYFQTSQFTDKSDVYSFGVVLVELLTGEKPISSTRSQECKGLTSYFILSMEKNCLYDIVDAQVSKMGKKEEIMAFANLAKKCLNLNGKKRPTMKEVASELERIRSSQKDSNFQLNYDEGEYIIHEVIEPWDNSFPPTSSTFDSISPWRDVQPLLTNKSL